MSITHDTISRREQAKYGPEWITFTEVSYGGFRFDLLAFNPVTKELEITEIDISCNSDPKKIAFAEKLGKVKVYRSNGDKIIPKSFQRIMKAVSSPLRMEMLIMLHDQGKQRYTDLLINTKMVPVRDAGKFVYHLKFLAATELIKTDKNGFYVITPKGAKIIRFCRELE